MGRIKPAQVKRISRKLFASYPDKFSTDFYDNKKVVSQLIESSKKVRNTITGYITKLVKMAGKLANKQ